MSNIVDFNGITRLNLDPDRVLNKAIGKLTDVIIIGYDKDGEEYFSSSIAGGPEITWLLDRMKYMLMNTVESK